MSHLLFRDAEEDLAPNARAPVPLRVAECGAAEGVGGVEVSHHQRVLDLGCDVEQIDGVVVPRKLERRLAGLFGWSGRRERGFFGREARTRRGRRDEVAAKTGSHLVRSVVGGGFPYRFLDRKSTRLNSSHIPLSL